MNFICQENLEAIILKQYMNEEKKKTAKLPLSIFSPYFGNRVHQKGERRAVETVLSYMGWKGHLLSRGGF